MKLRRFMCNNYLAAPAPLLRPRHSQQVRTRYHACCTSEHRIVKDRKYIVIEKEVLSGFPAQVKSLSLWLLALL